MCKIATHDFILNDTVSFKIEKKDIWGNIKIVHTVVNRDKQFFEIFEAIRHSRPLADPNPAFKEQLRLYQENGHFKEMMMQCYLVYFAV